MHQDNAMPSATDTQISPPIRRRRRTLMLSLLAVISFAGLAWLLRNPSPSEPVYKGLRLREWLAQNQDGTYVHDGAEDAVRQIGTNAIPTLLQMLRAHDSPLKLKLMELAQKQHVIPIHWAPAEYQAMAAQDAFYILGPIASNAVPGLIQIFKDRISDSSRSLATLSLFDISPASDAAIPVMAKTLMDSNSPADARVDAAQALAIMSSQPQLAVPALIHGLADPEPQVRALSAESLGSYGTNAEATVPALVNLWKDTNTDVWENTADALLDIDPQAAAKLGILPPDAPTFGGPHVWRLAKPR